MPKRLSLDTNVYLTGFDQPDNVDGQILRWLADYPAVTVLICETFIEQIRRVATRNRHKDFAGEKAIDCLDYQLIVVSSV